MTARTSKAIIVIGVAVVGAGFLALTAGPADERGPAAGPPQRFVELPSASPASSGPAGSTLATPAPVASPSDAAGSWQAPAQAAAPVEDPYAG